MEKVSVVTVRQAVQQLLHDGSIGRLGEFDQARVEQAHQVMIHKLKHQVETPLLLSKVHSVLLVRNYLLQAQVRTMRASCTSPNSQKSSVNNAKDILRYYYLL